MTDLVLAEWIDPLADLLREKTACMMRIRNEGRWIFRSLHRTFQVAKRVAILDDGSTDDTVVEAIQACLLCDEATARQINTTQRQTPAIVRKIVDGTLLNELHILHSPFRPEVRPRQGVSEIRDKNLLWEYCKSRVAFRHMLCLDGDEIISRAFIVNWAQAVAALEANVDKMQVPFVYFWDAEMQIRVDGIYGALPDGMPRLRFPRIFTIDRLSPERLFDCRFAWEGTKGGFHCGSVPMENFRPLRMDEQTGAVAEHETTTANYGCVILHYGYLDAAERQRKYTFYNQIDPGNKFEGEYKHIIGMPNQHAPGPVTLVPWQEPSVHPTQAEQREESNG